MQAGESETTTDREKIKLWTETRGGQPARVKDTKDLLRIDFHDSTPDPNLEHISWNEFFEEFERHKLEFLHQDKTVDGKVSRFFKFVRKA
jgi:hypothetical protein